MQASLEKHYQHIGENIYRFRVLRRMTQEELAAKASISATFLSKIERASIDKGFSCSTIMNIADALEVPACILMDENMCQAHLEELAKTNSLLNALEGSGRGKVSHKW